MTQLEIDRCIYPVLKYRESEVAENDIGIHAVVKLTVDQLEELHHLRKQKEISVRRMGVDELPLHVRWGGAMYWSEHQLDGETHFKQIVRFFPPDWKVNGLGLAFSIEMAAVARVAVETRARAEALIDKLIEKGIFERDEGQEILQKEWQDLVGESRVQSLIGEVRRVADAEEDGFDILHC